ncbi:MAG: hypothetical protein JXA67_13255 [Micromonosporaceae bacterium]|nr:hypothetical protein [Micromonosporaceae bacterium]
MLAGCTGTGEETAVGGAGSSGPSASSPAASPSAEVSAQPSETTEPTAPAPGPTGQPSATAAGEITVSGVIEAGVELNCLVLQTAERSYLLVGGDRAKLTAGKRVTVRGRLEPDLMTTCQQGTPLRVSEIQTG